MRNYHYTELLSPMARENARRNVFNRLRRYIPELREETMHPLLEAGPFEFNVDGSIAVNLSEKLRELAA